MVHQDFEKYADQKTFTLGASNLWNKTFLEFLPSTRKSINNVKFLDYGCGDGKYFHHLCNLGLQVQKIHGIEISQKRIDRCKNIGFSKVLKIQKSKKLPYKDNFFDVVNLMEVIEHIPKANGILTLAEIRRVLAPQGILLISTPNYPVKRFYDTYDAIFHQKWARFLDDPTHIAPYSYWEIKKILINIFGNVVDRSYKNGFLHRLLPHPIFLHKAFFVCHKTR